MDNSGYRCRWENLGEIARNVPLQFACGYLFPGITIGVPYTALKPLRHPTAAFEVDLTGWSMVAFFYGPHCCRLPYGA